MRAKDLQEFFPERYALRLEAAEGIPDVFDLVRDAVKERVGVVRSGLELGLAELGGPEDRMPCGLHPVGTNFILINKAAIRRVKDTRPELLRPFIFHALLHEYLHTIGLVKEEEARSWTLEVTLPLFGAEHPATKMAEGLADVLPHLAYSKRMPLPEGTRIEPVEDPDRSGAAFFA